MNSKKMNSTIKKLAQIFLLYGALSAYAQPPIDLEKANLKLKEWGLTIDEGTKDLNGPYVHFRQEDGKWMIEKMTSTSEAIPVQKFKSTEVLQFSADYSLVKPDYRVWSGARQDSTYVCAGFELGEDKSRRDYNPCDSSLTSTADSYVGLNVLAMTFSLGTSGTRKRIFIDPVKIVSLLEKSQLMDVDIPKLRREKWLMDYRLKFNDISTIRQLDSFVASYGKDDPDSLVGQAQAMRDSIRQNEEQHRAVKIREYDEITRYQAQEREKQIKIAAETKQRNLAAMQVQGTKICNSFKGIYEEYSGMSSLGRPVNYKIDGTYYVTGFIESVSGSRINIRTASVRHERPSGQSVILQTLTLSNEGITIQPGVLFWDDQGKWIPCSY